MAIGVLAGVLAGVLTGVLTAGAARVEVFLQSFEAGARCDAGAGPVQEEERDDHCGRLCARAAELNLKGNGYGRHKS